MAATHLNAHYVGLISGTSMDGIDAVVVRINTTDTNPSDTRPSDTRPLGLHIELLAGETFGFEPELASSLAKAKHLAETDPQGFMDGELKADLDQTLADAFARASLMIIEQSGLSRAEITAIGCHGQTVIHQPNASPPMSLQLGDGGRIAEQTGLLTVGQFRQADLAAGGQGAPLAPLLHVALFAHPQKRRAILNLGGIANLTLLRPNQPVVGFDTGPANVFLDLWSQAHTHQSFDANGQWAHSGQVHPPLLERFLEDPYFALPSPKSTGIEYFGQGWLNEKLKGFESLPPEDVQATLSELTAASVAQATEPFGSVDQIIVCGGGAHNADLMARLQRRLPTSEVSRSNQWGVDSDYLEAMLFAWLAHERLAERPLDTRSITGAKTPVVLGTLHHPMKQRG